MNKSVSKGRRYIAIGVFSLAVILFVGGSYFGKKRTSRLEKEGILTECTIKEVRGDYLRVAYSAEGTNYVYGLKRPYSRLQAGEKYMGKYLPDDREKVKVDFGKPVFNEQDFAETTCTLLNEKMTSWWFEYEVEGKVYTRVNRVSDNQKPSIDSHLVLYLKKNPKIGYLIKKE